MPNSPVLIRPSLDADLPSITAIYAHAVQYATGTFELDIPDLAEMTSRRAAVLEKNCPWLVAEVAGQVLGYAYAQPFRPRQAYRFTLEDSIYMHHEARGLGLGRLLLAELLARCQALGARQMLAVIGDSANVASVALHRSQGFVPVGTFKDVGHKLGQWRDVVLMQRALGPGGHAAPGDEPTATAATAAATA
jgi:L-amino acid N-acyltransferase YncA